MVDFWARSYWKSTRVRVKVYGCADSAQNSRCTCKSKITTKTASDFQRRHTPMFFGYIRTRNYPVAGNLLMFVVLNPIVKVRRHHRVNCRDKVRATDDFPHFFQFLRGFYVVSILLNEKSGVRWRGWKMSDRAFSGALPTRVWLTRAHDTQQRRWWESWELRVWDMQMRWWVIE